MRTLVTGADGFIGKNLVSFLSTKNELEIIRFCRNNKREELSNILPTVDCVIHLAGVNRSAQKKDFYDGNHALTKQLCEEIRAIGRKIPIVFASSIQASLDNDYGRSKLAAENELLSMASDTGSKIYIYRLPNVFGKWAKHNYNSVVATFCYNISRGIPITIHDAEKTIRLVYIDDLVQSLFDLINDIKSDSAIFADKYVNVSPEYKTSIAGLASQIKRFRFMRNNNLAEPVGAGLVRALYSTYMSYLPPNDFNYPLIRNEDVRGSFVEMLKTPSFGQFSFFTSHRGVTRGGHYHHSKTEKFLVVQGVARFRFKNIVTGEYHEVSCSAENPEIVETVPGWTHDVTNIGDDLLICILWANEVFDATSPDTFHCPID